MDNQNMDDLAAALNNHSITDDEGNVSENEDNFEEESATYETTPTEEFEAEPETGTEDEVESTQDDTEESESDLAEDDSGRRYVPEDRFKQVYGKMKATERELEAIRQLKAQSNLDVEKSDQPRQRSKGDTSQTDELLARQRKLEFKTIIKEYPQFDVNSPDYNPALDEMAGDFVKADPSLSLIDAAEKAVARAQAIQRQSEAVRSNNRVVKVQQAEGGIARPSVSRGEQQINPDNMTEAQLEAYLKQTGNW